MRKSRFFKLSILFVYTLILQTSFAQDHARWGLPDGAKVRLGKGWISGDVAYSPDGSLLAVASSIGTWLYDATTGAEVNLLSGHTRPVRCIDFSPDGAMLASCGVDGDNTVRVWDVRTGKPLKIFEGNAKHITALAFSPNGSTLAAGDGRIFLYGMFAPESACARFRDIRTRFSPWLSRPTASRLPVEASGTTTRFVCGTPARASAWVLLRDTPAESYRSHFRLTEECSPAAT